MACLSKITDEIIPKRELWKSVSNGFFEGHQWMALIKSHPARNKLGNSRRNVFFWDVINLSDWAKLSTKDAVQSGTVTCPGTSGSETNHGNLIMPTWLAHSWGNKSRLLFLVKPQHHEGLRAELYLKGRWGHHMLLRLESAVESKRLWLNSSFWPFLFWFLQLMELLLIK